MATSEAALALAATADAVARAFSRRAFMCVADETEGSREKKSGSR